MTLLGPYRVSGGWWAREVTRDYYYARAAVEARGSSAREPRNDCAHAQEPRASTDCAHAPEPRASNASLLWVFFDVPRNAWFLHGVVD
jgi:hypothetical protein